MSELTEYFLRHYTLVMDNDQYSYETVIALARDYLIGEEVTFSEYRDMSGQERADRFASGIGDLIITQIIDWFEEAVPDAQASIGTQLASEVMILNGSELEWALGDHYMPEVGDAEDFLPADDEDDEE